MLDFSARWTLWFESPNHLGAWATAVFFVLLSLLLLPQMKFSKNKWLPGTILIFIGFIVTSLWIAWSGSRAAWIAIAVGMMLAAYLIPTKKAWLLIAIGIFTIAIGIVSVDRVRDRAMTVTEMGQDGSSQSRPRTWSAACRMAAAHPINGIGAGNFSSFYSNWYEPEERNDTLRTANNDVLHLMAERGTLIVVLLLTLYLLSFALLIEVRQQQRVVLLGLSLASLSFFISGLFNNVLTFHTLWPWVFGTMSISLGASIRLLTWPQFGKRVGLCCVVSIIVCVSLLCYGGYLLRDDKALLIAQQNKAVVIPTSQLPRGNILIGGESDDRPRTFYRGIMRSLAEQGWQSELALGDRALQQALDLIPNNSPMPTYVISLRSSSAFMLAQLEQNAAWAQRLNGVVLCDAAFPESLRVEQVPFPLMSVYGRLNSPLPPENLVVFIKQLQLQFPDSLIFQAPWGTTWARLLRRLDGDIHDWLMKTNDLNK